MTAAYRLKGLGWFAGCVVVTLGFYLVSLQVAAERKHLDRVNARIGAAERDIRALETEFDVRANLAQLERWNGETLSLVAPVAGQFVRDEVQLAAINVRGVGIGGGAVQSAALLVPAFRAPVITQAAFIPAQPGITPTAPASTGVTIQTPAQAPAQAQTLAHAPVMAASARISVGAPIETAKVEAKIAKATVKLSKAQAVAMLDQSLLSDRTLGDLLKGARTEASRVR